VVKLPPCDAVLRERAAPEPSYAILTLA
jgi:hypothetical protein